jgi:hypothetical protein
MDPTKIDNFVASHPNLSFPKFRPLAAEECESLRTNLANKLGIPPTSSGLEVLKSLESFARKVPNVQPSDDNFSPTSLLLRVQSEPQVFINWSRFEHIDEMSAADFGSSFHDLWYPSSDDIEVFDKTLKWILMVRHYDAVESVQLS